ncbi:MAG: hypothetical protein ABI797_01860 [Chloroflexota bacterium]
MTRLLRAGLIVLALVALMGCSEIGIDLDTPPPPSGIRGLVLLGPTCPVEASPGSNEPVPCVTPYAAELVVLDSENVKIASVTSANDGRFSVDVPPGEYVVAPETGTDSYPIANPVSVTVVSGQYAEIQINYDTGIR